MSIWNWIFGGDVTSPLEVVTTPVIDVNPATGLPMLDGCGGVDVSGSPYGVDLHHNCIADSAMTDYGTSWQTPGCE